MAETQKIKEALARAAKTVTLRPERGQRTYRNAAIVGAGTLCAVEEAGRALMIDVGKALGGQDAGPNPSMILRSAISSCVAIGIKQWAARQDVDIDRVEVVLETKIDARGQLAVNDRVSPGFERIQLEIIVETRAPLALIDEIVALSLTYSPVFEAIANPQSVTRRVSLAGTDHPPHTDELA